MKLLIHHFCVQTNDYPASLAFYRDVLGMELISETEGFHGRDYNSWLRGHGIMIELQTPKMGGSFPLADRERAGLSHLCFYTADLDKAYDELKRGGAVFNRKNGKDIYEVNGGRLFKITAPEGTIIEFRDKSDC